MKALIVINGYSENRSLLRKVGRLIDALDVYAIDADVEKATRLLALSEGNTGKVLLEGRKYDFCLYLDKDAYLAKALSEAMPLFNSYRSLILSDDKMKTLQALKGTGIKAPKTISAPLCYVENPDPREVTFFLHQVENILSFPLVFKACHGSLGKQVALIKDRHELFSCYRQNRHIPHLYEEYLPYHPGHDYRLFVVGEKVVAAMERINEKDFRSNIALGGRGEDVTKTIPDAYKEVAIRASKELDLLYGGIDIAIGKDGEPIFLEANGNAFFDEIERVTKVDVASLVVNEVLERLKKPKKRTSRKKD